MIGQWMGQIFAVVRLEMRKTFFARRGLWVYLLAFAPAALYLVHSVDVTRQRERLGQIAQEHAVPAEAIHSIVERMSPDDVVAKLGEPYAKREFNRQFGRGKQAARNKFAFYNYTDGKTDFTIVFLNDEMTRISSVQTSNLNEDLLTFATVFQFFYLRLAVFFGCVGIFMNLFRGEMLDKSLHFYLLSPIRRELLLIGKYLAGLIATVAIFVSSTALQLTALLWHFDSATKSEYLHGDGWGHIAAYLGVTALACVGYGSIFLAAGLLFRNPIVPAASVLVWEGANIFLPAALKKISMIFYLQSLCPVVASPDADMPPPLRLLISTAEPASASAALAGIAILTLAVLVMASFQARKLEINYGAD